MVRTSFGWLLRSVSMYTSLRHTSVVWLLAVCCGWWTILTKFRWDSLSFTCPVSTWQPLLLNCPFVLHYPLSEWVLTCSGRRFLSLYLNTASVNTVNNHQVRNSRKLHRLDLVLLDRIRESFPEAQLLPKYVALSPKVPLRFLNSYSGTVSTRTLPLEALKSPHSVTCHTVDLFCTGFVTSWGGIKDVGCIETGEWLT